MASAVSLAACANPVPNADRAASHSLSAIPWPEADAILRHDAHWLGADGAWSVDLGGNRVLWLFADTFVDPGANPSRSSVTAAMVSITVAIQTGPWSDDVALYRPPECDIPGALVYSGKAHPHLRGADLVATYCTNASEFTQQLRNDALYYPRFVRLTRRR